MKSWWLVEAKACRVCRGSGWHAPSHYCWLREASYTMNWTEWRWMKWLPCSAFVRHLSGIYLWHTIPVRKTSDLPGHDGPLPTRRWSHSAGTLLDLLSRASTCNFSLHPTCQVLPWSLLKAPDPTSCRCHKLQVCPAKLTLSKWWGHCEAVGSISSNYGDTGIKWLCNRCDETGCNNHTKNTYADWSLAHLSG